MITVLVADDHPLFRTALAQAVQLVEPSAQVLQAETFGGARSQLERAQQGETGDIDLLLLDLHMPGNQGLTGLATLRGEFPTVAMAMVSAHEDPDVIQRALAFGALAFIPKSADLPQLAVALREIMQGRRWLPPRLATLLSRGRVADADVAMAQRLARLTPQQFRVLRLLAEGRLNKQIADQLDIQERTVKAHVSAIFERLGVRNRTQAGMLLGRLQLADPVARPVIDAPADGEAQAQPK